MALKLTNPTRNWSKDFWLLATATFTVGIFFGIHHTIFFNFVNERFGIEAKEMGVLEGIREIPGFLNFVFIALMIHFAPPIVAGLALVVMGSGVLFYGQITSVFVLTVFAVVWSLGFHCWWPLEQTMALRFSPKNESGKRLGQLSSVANIATLLGIGVCVFAFKRIGYTGLFIIAGSATIIGGFVIIFASKAKPAIKHDRIVFKRRYMLFYVLQFLQGCRKQILMFFAPFALVKIHSFPVETMIAIGLINKSLVVTFAPFLGRLIDRLGERTMLRANYLGLVFVFCGYALVRNRLGLYILFGADNLLFFSAIALSTYVHKIAPEEDLKPTLSMGIAMNHVSAVAIPLFGGVLWTLYGYRVIFYISAAIALISYYVSGLVNTQKHPRPT